MPSIAYWLCCQCRHKCRVKFCIICLHFRCRACPETEKNNPKILADGITPPTAKKRTQPVRVWLGPNQARRTTDSDF